MHRSVLIQNCCLQMWRTTISGPNGVLVLRAIEDHRDHRRTELFFERFELSADKQGNEPGGLNYSCANN